MGNNSWTGLIEYEAAGECHRSESLKIAEIDLFSEVALPAGISAIFPPFGVGANSGFVSHGAAAGDVNGDGLLDIAATVCDVAGVE